MRKGRGGDRGGKGLVYFGALLPFKKSDDTSLGEVNYRGVGKLLQISDLVW